MKIKKFLQDMMLKKEDYAGENIPEREREQKLMRMNRLISDDRSIKKMLLLGDIMILLFFNYVMNLADKIFRLHYTLYDDIWGFSNFFRPFALFHYPITYVMVLLLLLFLDFNIYYKFKISFSEDNFNVQQKGTSRFTTVDELKQQYRQIDEAEGDYEGMPGMLISTYDGKHFIDDGNTNTCVIGISRAGKDEIFVLTSINDYSRSMLRPSIATVDIKGEAYRSTKRVLEKRGYKVLAYNLSNPSRSISINYLDSIYELFKEKDYDTGENLAYSYAFSLFSGESKDSENSFFWTNAAALLCALIIAVIEDCIKKDEEENIRRKVVWEEKQKQYQELDEEGKKIARKRFQEYKGKDVVTDKSIPWIPIDESYEAIYPNQKYANIYNVIVTFSELCRKRDPETDTTALDDFFRRREPTDRAKLKYLSVEIASDRARGDIYSSMATKLTVFMQEAVSKISLTSDFDMKDLGFGDVPIALFIILPDYETSLHPLATIFIQQSYYMLARECDEHMRCKRPVRYIINECGNIPKIEHLSNFVTVGLGRNITFDIYIQSIQRMETLYGKDAATIIGNCGNQIYLLANDYETAETYSKMLGNKTIIDVQRNGEKMSLNKTYMERPEKLPLFDPNELLELKPGHCVVRRTMKRTDLKGNSIRPRPIYNCAENGTVMKFRYQYLGHILDDPYTIKLSDILPKREDVDLTEYVDYKTIRAMLQQEEREKRIGDLSKRDYDRIMNMAKKAIEGFSISDNATIQELLKVICEEDMPDKYRKILIKEIEKVA